MDPGFPRRSAILPKGVATYYLINFPRKLRETEENFDPGDRPSRPLDPPLRTMVLTTIENIRSINYLNYVSQHLLQKQMMMTGVGTMMRQMNQYKKL